MEHIQGWLTPSGHEVTLHVDIIEPTEERKPTRDEIDRFVDYLEETHQRSKGDRRG